VRNKNRRRKLSRRAPKRRKVLVKHSKDRERKRKNLVGREGRSSITHRETGTWAAGELLDKTARDLIPPERGWVKKTAQRMASLLKVRPIRVMGIPKPALGQRVKGGKTRHKGKAHPKERKHIGAKH